MELRPVSSALNSAPISDREAKLETLRAMMLKRALQVQSEFKPSETAKSAQQDDASEIDASARDIGKGLKLDLRV